MNKIMLATGMMVSLRLRDGALHRLVQRQPLRVRTCSSGCAGRGPFAPIFWLMMFCNVVVPQIFWFKKCAHQPRVDAWVAVAAHQRRHVVRAVQHRRHLACTATSSRRSWEQLRADLGRHHACSSAPSACSRRCSCCSSSSSPRWRSPRSRSCATSWRTKRRATRPSDSRSREDH